MKVTPSPRHLAAMLFLTVAISASPAAAQTPAIEPAGVEQGTRTGCGASRTPLLVRLSNVQRRRDGNRAAVGGRRKELGPGRAGGAVGLYPPGRSNGARGPPAPPRRARKPGPARRPAVARFGPGRRIGRLQRTGRQRRELRFRREGGGLRGRRCGGHGHRRRGHRVGAESPGPVGSVRRPEPRPPQSGSPRLRPFRCATAPGWSSAVASEIYWAQSSACARPPPGRLP